MNERPSHIVGRRPGVPADTVRAIRREAKFRTPRQLEKLHGVPRANVSQILRFNTYKWVK